MEAEIENLKKEDALLKAQVYVLRSGINESLFHVERSRLRRTSLWWIILCFICVACTVDAILKLKIIHAFGCFTAFLFNWRGLYIEQNASPSLLALCIVIISIFTL